MPRVFPIAAIIMQHRDAKSIGPKRTVYIAVPFRHGEFSLIIISRPRVDGSRSFLQSCAIVTSLLKDDYSESFAPPRFGSADLRKPAQVRTGVVGYSGNVASVVDIKQRTLRPGFAGRAGWT